MARFQAMKQINKQ